MDGIAIAILAGGLGTRLRSAVPDRPKVLAEVNGRPFLAYLLDKLAAGGAKEVTLLVGYAAAQVRAAFGGAHGRLRLAYSEEPEPLGTAGAIRFALPHLAGHTVLLLNGDSYCDLDLAGFRHFHEANPGHICMALAHVPDAGRFGRVQLADNRVTGFEEKRADHGPGWINAGVYLIPRTRLEEIPDGRAVSLEREVMPDWVAGGLVCGFAGGGRFIDIGTPESYAEAEAFFAPAEEQN